MKMNDQASKLRIVVEDILVDEIVEYKPSRHTMIYSVVSGKGGVGKTNFSINLAIKLRQEGKRVLILDADIGMNNVNILLGIAADLTLSEVINGEARFRDIIIKGPEGVDLICGGTDLFLMESLHTSEQEEIIKSLEEFGEYDIIIIDNGAGINKHSLTFSSFADEIILVTTPEPTALTDAYRVVKANSLYDVRPRVKVVINQIANINQGQESFNKLQATSQKFLNVDLGLLGFIFHDARVNKSIMEQRPVVLKYPKSLASENIGTISKIILGESLGIADTGSFKKLGNRLIKFFG